eukprot:scaffold164_cov212-Alexandrium_tamarense.AAC.14
MLSQGEVKARWVKGELSIMIYPSQSGLSPKWPDQLLFHRSSSLSLNTLPIYSSSRCSCLARTENPHKLATRTALHIAFPTWQGISRSNPIPRCGFDAGRSV